MSLALSLNPLNDNAAQMTPTLLSGVDVRLLKAAQIRGEFPTSLSLLNRIRALLAAEGASVRAVADLVCVDPVLALRVISIANYDFYRKAEPALTVAAALEQLTLAKLTDILGNLAEAKNYNALYLGRAVSSTMLQQAILSGLLARGLAALMELPAAAQQQVYAAAALSNLGPLLLAFYAPNLFSGICLDCMDDRALFERVFRRVMRKSIGDFAAAAARTLSLPPPYEQLAVLLDEAPWKGTGPAAKAPEEQISAATAIYLANQLAHEICYFTGIQGIQSLVRDLDPAARIDPSDLEDLVGTAPDGYLDQCKALAVKPVRLPEYLLWFAPVHIGAKPVRWRLALPGINERINPFLYELRACFKTRAAADQFSHLPQAVYCTLSALIKGLNFDRAILFRADDDRRFLQPLLCHGVKLFEPEKLRRFIADPDRDLMPDIQAYLGRQAVFTGQPVFNDGWPFATFPVIHRGRVLGVFYADKIRRPDSDALDAQEQISCVALAEEWHDIPADFC